MSLKFADKEELLSRYNELYIEIDDSVKEIGILLEGLGRSKKELTVIHEELERRNVEIPRP